MAIINTSPSFLNVGDGVTEISRERFGGEGVYTYATNLAVLPNGYILSALSTNSVTNPPVGVALFDTNGNLVTSFGSAGVVELSTAHYAGNFPSIAVDGVNGKFVLAGYQSITKYNFDGSVDTNFADDGVLTESLGSNWISISSVKFDSSGRLILTNSNGTIARFTEDGEVDSTFAGTGVLSANVKLSALQSDGQILAANWSGVISRYNPDGSVDASFASTTVAATRISSLLSGGYFNPSGLIQQADGKILISGTVSNSSSGSAYFSEFAIARFNADGSLDTSFARTGIKEIPYGTNQYAQATTLDIQPDGKILIAGNVDRATVTRLNPDGTFDTSFSGDGNATLPFGFPMGRVWDIAVQSDGKIVLSGDGNYGSQVVRLTANGELDTSFSAGVIDSNTQISEVTYRALSNPVPLTPAGLIVSDAGLVAQGNFGGTSVTLVRHNGANSQDQFSAFGGRLSALTENGIVALDGISIGTVNQNSGGTLFITFNSAATQAQVNTVLSSIAYSNSSSSVSGNIQLDWTFSDGNSGSQGSGGPLSTTAFTVVEATSSSSASQIYIDLGLNPNSDDYSSSSTSVRGGPNGFYYNDSDNSWSSQYYRWPDPAHPLSVTNRVELSANGNTPILPPSSQLQVIGEPLYYGHWAPQTINGNTFWVEQPAIHDLNPDLGLMRIKANGNYASVQLDFAPWVDAATTPTYFSLSAAGAQQTQNWVSLPAVWDNNPQSSTQITGLKAKVVADASSGYYNLLIGRFNSAGELINDLTGSQMTQVLRQINLIDNNTTPHQAAYSFTIEVSNNAQANNLAAATWYGASGPGQADDTTVYFDSLAPAPSTLYVAQNSLFLAMNGAGGSSGNNPGNTAQHQWQGVVDSKLLSNFTATVNGNQVQILNIQSEWNGYVIDLANPVALGQTVTLSYTPPAGTVGINQIDGVVQDEAGNDAAAFTISGVMSGSNTSIVVNALSSAGYTNDDNLSHYHYFKGTGPEVDDAESLTLVSFSNGRATFQFNMPYLPVGNQGLDGITIAGATSITNQFEAVVDLKPGSNPFISGFFTGVNQTFNDVNGNDSDRVREYLDALNLLNLVSFKNTAIGNNGASQFISEQIFSGSAGLTQADDLSNVAGFIGNDTFYTGSASDTIYGFGGNDTFISGIGYDTIDGGFGSDTASFAGAYAASGIRVTLGDLFASGSAANGSAIGTGLNGILKSIENVVGSSYNDTITGNQANNILDGGAGGNDSLLGGGGNDTLIAGLAGNNYLDGGDGLDTAILSGDSNQWSLYSYSGTQVVMSKNGSGQQVTVSRGVESIAFSGSNGSGSSIVYDVAGIIQSGQLPNYQQPSPGSGNSFVGSYGNDYLYGNDQGNTMWGMGGNDTLRSGTGNDTLIGGSGDNVLIGGAGNDTYAINYVSDYVVSGIQDSTKFLGNFNTGANLSSQTIFDNSGVDTLTVTVNSPEIYNSNYYLNIRRGGINGSDFYLGIRDGSQSIAGQDAWFGKVTIAGQYEWNGFAYTGNNTIENLSLSGNLFNDTVNIALGAGSSQTVLYGTGRPDFIAGFGSGNTIFGGDGNDYLAGSRLDTQVELDVYNLRNGLTGSNAVTLDVYTATGVVQRSNAGTLVGDTLYGGAGNDNLNGYYGNDYLDGGTGADVLMGWEGNDTYIIDNTGDSIDENGGIDTIITNLGSLDLRSSQYAGVENLISSALSGSNNTLYGNSGSNIIIGGAGNDTIDGFGGADTLQGGGGNDTIILRSQGSSVDGGDGIDTLQLASDWSASSLTLTNSSIGNTENVVYSGSSSFTLTGNTLNNTLTTGSGNDSLDGGLGNDTLIGNAGNDTYAMSIGANTVTTNGVSTLVTTGGSDTFIDYSGTSSLKVTPSGSTSTFSFTERGTDGNLYTRTYADSFGKQLLATQTLMGNFANEGTQVSIGVSNYTLTGAGNSGGYQDFTLVAGNTVFSYNANYTQNNLLIGSVYNDTMTGGAGRDWIEAGSGNDRIVASSAYDRIDGGLGADTATYSAFDNLSAGVKGIMVLATDQGNNASLNDYYVFKGQNYTTGSFSAESLLASGSADYLQSVEHIAGTAQSDLFIGGYSSDWFAGRGGLDTFYGGTTGERGTDWVDYNTPLLTIGITANLGTSTGTTNLTLGGRPLGSQFNTITGTVNTQMGPDTLYNIEGIRGTNYSDTLIGSTASNWLRGGLGNDVLIGVGNGLAGSLVDNATDWADYFDNTSGVTVNLGVGTNAASALNLSSIAGISISGMSYGTATGGDGNDILIGMTGVRGGSGGDILIGGAGNDWLAGNQGNDTLIGGAGNDTASYKWADGSVTVNLGVGTYNYSPYNYGSGIDFNGQTWGTSTGADGFDTLVGVDRAVGSRFDDTLTGNSGDNVFRGLDGNDTIDGGTGSDWISYVEALTINNSATNSAIGITVDLSSARDANGYINVTVADGNELLASASTDKLKNIENIAGTIYNDTLIGDAGENTLQGFGGNDVLKGGAGIDTADFRPNSSGINASLSDAGINNDAVQGGTVTSSSGNSMLYGIENIRGSEYNDTIIGNVGANTIDGGAGNDSLDGGGGNDTISYRSALGGVTVNLGNGTTSTVTGAAGTDEIIRFENIIGSSYADTLTAYTGGSVIDAGAGNDTVIGNAGDDILRGGKGNDLISGGAGTDRAMFSGLYTDYSYIINTANSSESFAGITLTGADGKDIVKSDVEYIGFDNSSGVVMDVAQSVRYGTAIFVSDGVGNVGSSNPTITGTTANDILTGSAVANQTLIGLAGNDVLDGGGGSGTTAGSAGGDTLIGGQGNDTYVVYSYADKVVEDFNAGTDTVQARVSYILPTNAENLTMTYFNSGLTYLGLGNNLDNSMTGGAGADKLYGRDGNDALSGLSGNDYLAGGNGNDTLLGGDGNDALYGNSGSDTIYGGAGNDIIDSGTGVFETVVGGAGDDIYIVNENNFNWSSKMIENENEGNDTVITSNGSFTLADHLENLAFVGITGGNGTGNSLANMIVGNTGSNTLDGGAGNDTLYGDTANTSLSDGMAGGTSDYLIGGAGNDLIWGQSGDDTLDGGTGNDTLYGGTGNDTYYVDSSGDYAFDAANLAAGSSGGLINTGGVDWIYATATVDMGNTNRFQYIEHVRLLDTAQAFTMTGSDYYSTQYVGMIGTSSNNILTGNQYDNWISGLSGNDTINGGGGDDVITGGLGNDTLDGGYNGMDVLLYGTGDIYDTISKNDGRYGYDLVATLTNHNGAGIKANLNGYDYRFDANNMIQAYTVTGSSNVNSGTDLVYNIDAIIGTNFNDTIVGHDGNNFISGGRGNDTLVGAGGFDVLGLGGNSNYGLTLDLGAMRLADNTIVSMDWSRYQAQNTALVINLAYLSTEANTYYDGITTHSAGTFTNNGGNGLGTITFWGFEGIALSETNDTLYGTTGNDFVQGLLGNDVMFGGDGNDILYGNAQTTGILAGTEGHDHDTVYGGTGNDTLYAGAGDSTLLGETGDDSLIGAYGGDTLLGGDGNDFINGAEGDDVLNGGTGFDNLFGGVGNDILIGGGSYDNLNGGTGNDTYLYTGNEGINENFNEGIDSVLVTTNGYFMGGNIENAALANMPGATPNLMSLPAYLYGNEQANVLLGNTGDNTLGGNGGNDTIAGYGGDDIIYGGYGNDLFALTLDPTDSIDPSTLNGFGGTIMDFNRYGENDQFLLNFVAGGSGNTGFHYQLNVGYGASFINGSAQSDGTPEAMITYDPGSGLLQIAFQHETSSGSGQWTYAGDNGNTNLSFIINGANDNSPAMNINAASFTIDPSIDLTHPMQDQNSYWGTHQV